MRDYRHDAGMAGAPMIRRLRPAYTPDQLAELYRTPHQHRQWSDHCERVAHTINMALSVTGGAPVDSIADLSCGDATIPRGIPARTRILGDYAPGYPITGALEDTIDQIPHVDWFVCSETLEHVDDPDLVLSKIRTKSDRLLLSTPLDEPNDDNPEHYWAWDRQGIEDLLTRNGWTPTHYGQVTFRELNGCGYQLWVAR